MGYGGVNGGWVGLFMVTWGQRVVFRCDKYVVRVNGVCSDDGNGRVGMRGIPLVWRVEGYIYIYRYARKLRVGWCNREVKFRTGKGGLV